MNRGAQKLAQLTKGTTQAALAEALGVDQGYLSKVLSGKRVPGLRVRRLLLARFKIDLGLWDEVGRLRGAA